VGSSYEKGLNAYSLSEYKKLTYCLSTLLKSDQWLRESHKVEDGIRGAINFRNVHGTKIYALGQPTLEAIDEVVKRVRGAYPSVKRMIWITLREEPIVYVHGSPYCLRRESFSLRNMKGKVYSLASAGFELFKPRFSDYGGISASRLEILEKRLREDIVSELQSFDGRYDVIRTFPFTLSHTELVQASTSH
jgi:hypothetical protein